MKKFLSLVLSALMLLNASIPVMAETITLAGNGGAAPITANVEAATFSVTVPTSLVISVDNKGEVLAATEASIVNNSVGPAKVSNIEISGVDPWETVDYDSINMATEKVDSRKIAFEIMNDKTTGSNTNTFTEDNWPIILGANDTDSDELPLVYSAKVPAQSQAINGIEVINVVFTIDWDSIAFEEVQTADLVTGTTVPEGGTYYVGVTSTSVGDYVGDAVTVYNAGDTLPEISDGDVFVLGDYEYRYNQECDTADEWGSTTTDGGWGVRTLSAEKTAYGQIYKTINGANVTNARSVFANCSLMISSPAIPTTVTNMRTAFYYCTALISTPVIPSDVTSLQSTFAGCSSLKNAPTIPDKVVHMGSAFDSCTALKSAPEIPYGVENMRRAFFGCTKLVTGPSAIPNSVTTMEKTFYNCTILESAPAIPASVSNVQATFYGCEGLTTVEVNTDPTTYDNFLTNSNITTITGSTTMADELLATK